MNIRDLFTENGKSKLYGMITTEEVRDVFPEGSAVKVEEDLFLVRENGSLFLLDKKDPENARGPLTRFEKTDELVKFETEVSLASGTILPALFGEDTLKLGDTDVPAEFRKINGKFFLALLPEGDVLVLDLSRFLLYASIGGEFVTGYIEV